MTEKPTIKWYLHRLAAMSAKEIAWRLKRKISAPFVRKSIINQKLPFSPAEILSSANTLIGCQPIDPKKIQLSDAYLKRIIKTADEVCAGKISLFNRDIQLDDPPNWYHDYAHNFDCPKIDSDKINYRNPSQTGDVMFIWWLNRHQYLLPVAIAFFATQNQKYSDCAINHLKNWLDECPYPKGPAWLTGIEAGVRLITWSWLFRFLFAKGRPENCADSFLKKFLVSIRQHVRFIDTHWAKYSSANNHIIAEAVGVIAAIDTFPQLFPEKYYKKICLNILKDEINKQVAHDGVNKEHAVSYHAFVLELLINASHFSATIRNEFFNVVSKMGFFLDTLLDDKNNIPDIGDSDNAVASGIIPRDKNYYAQIAATARTIATPANRKTANIISAPAQWYCGTEIISKPDAKSQYFETGGYAVWKTTLDNGLKINLCMNLAELGYGNIAAHGHADALSFTLSVNGEPVFIDPGTYAYHDEKIWRDYFRSTRAHNSLVINSLDQAEIKGPFLWADKYYVHTDHVIMSDDQLNIKAEHDGYFRDVMTLSHKRELSWHPMLKKWIIRDELVGNGNYDAELFFHVHPDRKVVQQPSNIFKIFGTGFVLTLKFSSHFFCRVAKGESDPPLGWFSPVFGQKTPSPTIHAKGKVIGFDNIFTEFFIEKIRN